MSNNRPITPLHIELLIHIHTTDGPFARPSQIAERYTRQLAAWGMIQADKDSGSGFRTTEGGTMWLDAMCALPRPRRVMQWTMDGDPMGEAQRAIGEALGPDKPDPYLAAAIHARVAEASDFKRDRMIGAHHALAAGYGADREWMRHCPYSPCPYHSGRSCALPACRADDDAANAKKKTVQVDASLTTTGVTYRTPSGHLMADTGRVVVGHCQQKECDCAGQDAEVARGCVNLLKPSSFTDDRKPHAFSLGDAHRRHEGWIITELGVKVGHCVCKAHDGCQCVSTLIPADDVKACCYFVPLDVPLKKASE